VIYLNNISLSFADRRIFEGVTCMIPEKSRIGLVGDNGTGKTTLFRIILGLVEPDQGAVDIPNRKNRTIGYLPQDLVELEPLPLLDYLRNKSGLAVLEASLQDCENRMSRCDPGSEEYDLILKSYEITAARFQACEGYRFEAKAKQILNGFGFRDKDFSKNCMEFSGGWKMRIFIALILLSAPDIMLLDEPTNHLDTESMEWLESYLKNYHGTLLTIAHDRVFLDLGTVKEMASVRLNGRNLGVVWCPPWPWTSPIRSSACRGRRTDSGASRGYSSPRPAGLSTRPRGRVVLINDLLSFRRF